MSKWEELEKAARSATQGDTTATGNGVHIRTRCVLTTHMEPPEQRQADARYYAAANPSAILELLAERDALKAELDRIRAMEPVAWLRFWAYQRVTHEGAVDADEGYEVCKKTDTGMDGRPAFPVYTLEKKP